MYGNSEPKSNMVCVFMNYDVKYCETLQHWLALWDAIYCPNNLHEPKQTQMFTTWEKRGILFVNYNMDFFFLMLNTPER